MYNKLYGDRALVVQTQCNDIFPRSTFWLCLELCEKAVCLGDPAVPVLVHTVDYILKIRGQREPKGEGGKNGCYVVV